MEEDIHVEISVDARGLVAVVVKWISKEELIPWEEMAVSTCAVCGSRFHWARVCPNKEESALANEEELEQEKSDNENAF